MIKTVPSALLGNFQRKIRPELLIARDFYQFTSEILRHDQTLKVYLNHTSVPVDLSSGDTYPPQAIQTQRLGRKCTNFIISAIRRLDRQLELDFKFVSRAENAGIRFYFDSEIQLPGQGVTLGIAHPTKKGNNSYWDIILNKPAFNNDKVYLKYAILHEFGHSLGLEHSFDGSDGDVFQTTNSDRGAHPEETLMAYRSPRGEVWPNWYSDNDLKALRRLWGREVGGGFGDVLTGEQSAHDSWGTRSQQLRCRPTQIECSADGLLDATGVDSDFGHAELINLSAGLASSTSGDLG